MIGKWEAHDRRQRGANMVIFELRVRGSNPVGHAYMGINIVTHGGAKTGVYVGATNKGPIRKAP